jgi:hypothetical protein
LVDPWRRFRQHPDPLATGWAERARNRLPLAPLDTHHPAEATTMHPAVQRLIAILLLGGYCLTG